MAMLKLSENRKRNQQAEQILEDPDGYYKRARQRAEQVVDERARTERSKGPRLPKTAR